MDSGGMVVQNWSAQKYIFFRHKKKRPGIGQGMPWVVTGPFFIRTGFHEK
jgi:hypothetical protein